MSHPSTSGYSAGYMQKAGAPAEGMPGFIGPMDEWSTENPTTQQHVENFYRQQYNIPGFHKGYLEDPGRRILGTYAPHIKGEVKGKVPGKPYFPRARSIQTYPMDFQRHAENVEDYNKLRGRYKGQELSLDEREKLDEFNSNIQEEAGVSDPTGYDLLRASGEAADSFYDSWDKVDEIKKRGRPPKDKGFKLFGRNKDRKAYDAELAAATSKYDETRAEKERMHSIWDSADTTYNARTKDLLELGRGRPTPRYKEPAQDVTHSAPMKPGYAEDIKKRLPGFDVHQSSTVDDLYNRPDSINRPPVPPVEDGTGYEEIMMNQMYNPTVGGFAVAPGYNKRKPRIIVPRPGPSGLPIAMHEYTHAVDPAIKEKLQPATVAQDTLYDIGSRAAPAGVEVEIPAMTTERAVEASPYLPPERRRPFTTPMGKQIEKFGPTLRGNFRGDLGNIENWMQALRRRPGAGIQAKKPFAYHGDTRTPQQRAKALGSAYQGWMNGQPYKDLGAEFKTPKPLMSTTQKSYLPASIRAPDQEAE